MIQRPFFGNALVATAIAIIGLLIHGTEAGKLGLYWDDAGLFLGAMQNVDGDAVRFILRDVPHFLSSERPLAYLPFMVSRAGFAVSLSLAHWISVVFLVLAAVVLATFARRILDEAWFSFAVGVVFLTYPLAPLQALWLSIVHHIWAAILAFLAMLLFLRGMKTSETGELGWFVLALLVYSASILTHEVFILIPPTFVAVYLLLKGGQKSSNWNLLGSAVSHRRVAVYGLGLFLMPMAAYGLWREWVLPSYGFRIYSLNQIALGALAEKFLNGVETAFVPLDDAVTQILGFPPAPGYVFLSAILSLAVWAIILRLRSSENRRAADSEDPRLYAATCGAALALSGIAVLALSPASIGGVAGMGFVPRVNFVMTFGVALAVPGFLGLLVSPYNRFTPFAGLLSVAFLLYVGFTSSLLDIDKLFHPSTFFVVLGEYSLKHRLMVFGYLIVGTLLILVVILSSLIGVRRAKHLPISDRLDALWSGLSAHFVAGSVACFVLLGSLFCFSIKGEYIDKWNRHKSMLKQLQTIAPRLQDDTFVVIVHNPHLPWPATYTTYHEISGFLRALYDNRSIRGDTDLPLRFHQNGVESTYYGNKLRGRNPRISYDRFLILQFDGRNLRMLPKIDVKTVEGKPLVVPNNPNRILSGTPTKSAVWRYIAE